MPPILEPLPLQLNILHKGNYLSEYRIWFSGASMVLNYSDRIKPVELSVIPFYNVQHNTESTTDGG